MEAANVENSPVWLYQAMAGLPFCLTFGRQTHLGMIYNHNGELREGSDLQLPVDSRIVHFGDGLFESIRFAQNRLNFWEDHYFRLMAGMRILRMEIPLEYSPEYLEEQIRQSIAANDLEQAAARVKLLMYRQGGGRYTPDTNHAGFLIFITPLKESSFELNEKGLEVDLFKDYYVQKGLLSNLKTTAATLYTVASIYRQENDLDECILVNDDKQVAEAISANIFIVKDKTVYTPPLETGCLKGVMRKQVLSLLPKMDYEVKEEAFSPFELQRADEVFLTNAIQGVRWVGQYRKKSYENTCSALLVKRLNVKVALG